MKKYKYKIIFVFVSLFSLSCQINSQDDSKVIAQIDSEMRSEYPDSKPGAAIVVMENNKPLFTSAYGLSNIEAGTKNEINTLFRIGSITKQFTSIGIMMLIEENKLSLDSPIHLHFPNLFDRTDETTVRHLLTHTSGIIDLSRIRAVRPLMNLQTPAYELVSIISKEEKLFKPGERHSYSNSGYVILGALLEKITGLSYEDFLNERIFKTLDMNDTHFKNKAELQMVADGYFAREDHFVEAPDIDISLLFAAGGLWSNVTDMAKWNEALYTNKLVNRDFIKMAFEPHRLSDHTLTDYGFGFRNCKVNELNSIEHGGGVFGYSSYGVRIEDAGIYVLILTNFERNNSYDKLAPKVAALVAGAPYDLEFKGKKLRNRDIYKVTGNYTNAQGDTMIVQTIDNQLYITKNNGDNKKLKALNKDTFIIDNTLDDRVTFNNVEKSLIWKPRRAMGIRAYKS